MKTWGPWTQGKLNKLRYDVRGYFRTYYAELRRLIAEYEETADIPRWFNGGRQITTSCCGDGVVVVHEPYDLEAMAFPERDDSYNFHLAAEHGRLWSVGRRLYGCRPKMPDGRRIAGGIPDYAQGEDFGIFVRLWPAYEGHPAPDGYQLNVMSQWTRLDAASMSNLGRWRDRTVAYREAWEALRPYVEGGDVPVPREVS